MPKISSNWYYHFRCAWTDLPKLTKTTILLIFCNIWREKWGIKLIFCMQINMTVYKLILWFWWGWSNIPKVSKIANLECLYNIPKKKLEMKLIFCMKINIKILYELISTLWTLKFPKRWYYIIDKYDQAFSKRSK